MLLLIGAIHFVVVRTATTKKGSSNVHITKIFDVGGTIHQTPMYGTFGVRTWRKKGLKSVNPLLTSTRVCYAATISLLVRQYVMGAAEATRKPILQPRPKKHGHGLQKTDRRLGNSRILLF